VNIVDDSPTKVAMRRELDPRGVERRLATLAADYRAETVEEGQAQLRCEANGRLLSAHGASSCPFSKSS
jgi:hypothetical protein